MAQENHSTNAITALCQHGCLYHFIHYLHSELDDFPFQLGKLLVVVTLKCENVVYISNIVLSTFDNFGCFRISKAVDLFYVRARVRANENPLVVLQYGKGRNGRIPVEPEHCTRRWEVHDLLVVTR